MNTNLRKRIENDLAFISEKLREQKRTPPPFPISPLHFSQKLGFKPVVTCDCGAVLDTNVVISHQKKAAWTAQHQDCEPQRASVLPGKDTL